MNAEKGICEHIFVRPQIFSSVKKFLRLLQNRVQATHLFLRVMTWGGVLQASVMTWGGVVKPPVMPMGVGVGPYTWDCLRGTLRINYVLKQLHCIEILNESFVIGNTLLFTVLAPGRKHCDKPSKSGFPRASFTM